MTPDREPHQLPKVPRSKEVEERSRIIFNSTVHPWLVTLVAHDYGIDAIVEITRPTTNGSFATGRRFAVQLKGTEDTEIATGVRVKPVHVNYWLNSTEPVLIAHIHLPTETVYWRWADQELRRALEGRDLSWFVQETVTVPVPTNRTLGPAAFQVIETYVGSHTRPPQVTLSPGQYEGLQRRTAEIASRLAVLAAQARFESVRHRLSDLSDVLRNSTYLVAFAGQPRAGKSTLLNALLGREVSPVGRFPTTAVALRVVSSPSERVEVFFEDGTTDTGPVDPAFLSSYATQDENPDNEKRVRLLVVGLSNQLLERGVSYADAPGLHDASPVIRQVTDSFLGTANVVVYVLDVYSAAAGGFAITQTILDDLRRLSERAHRLFLILNKVDNLTAEQLLDVQRYVETTLRKYGIWDVLGHAPIPLSARNSWQWRAGGGGGDSPHAPFEHALWKYLLQTNSTGLHRMRAAVAELRRAGAEFGSILRARSAGGARAAELVQALEVCRTTESQLAAKSRAQRDTEVRHARANTSSARSSIAEWLRERLSSVPLEQELPAPEQIQAEVQTAVLQVFQTLWKDSQQRFRNHAVQVEEQVERSLIKARLATGVPLGLTFVMPMVAGMETPVPDDYQEAWAGSLMLGLVGLAFGGWIAVAGGVLGWVLGLSQGRQKQRDRRIAKIIEQTDKSLGPVFLSLGNQIQEKIVICFDALGRHVHDRLIFFVEDIERQLAAHGTPLTQAQQAAMNDARIEVEKYQTELDQATGELSDLGEQRP